MQTAVDMPPHPPKSKDATRTFAERIYLHLKQSPSGLPVDRVGTTIDKPPNAEKVGKVLKKYSAWFKRESVKGEQGVYQLLVVIARAFGSCNANKGAM